MITNKEYVRLIIKNSDEVTQRPTASTQSITDFEVTDILESELYYNSASRQLYSRSGNDITLLIGTPDLIFQKESTTNVACNVETDVLICDTSNNNITVDMPLVTQNKVITIKNKGSGTVEFNSSFDNNANIVLDNDNEFIKVYFDINWKIISHEIQ